MSFGVGLGDLVLLTRGIVTVITRLAKAPERVIQLSRRVEAFAESVSSLESEIVKLEKRLATVEDKNQLQKLNPASTIQDSRDVLRKMQNILDRHDDTASSRVIFTVKDQDSLDDLARHLKVLQDELGSRCLVIMVFQNRLLLRRPEDSFVRNQAKIRSSLDQVTAAEASTADDSTPFQQKFEKTLQDQGVTKSDIKDLMTAVAKKEKQLNKVTPTFQSLEAATLEALDYLYGEPIEDISCETIFNPHYTAQRHKILKSCDIWNVVILCQSLQRICTELSDELANDPSALDDNTKGTFEKNLGKTIDTLMRFSPLLLLALADSSVSLADGTRNSAFWTSEKVENGARLLDALKRLKLFIIKYQASQDKSTGQSVEAHRSSKSRIFSSTADSTYSNVDNSGTTLSSLQRDLSKSCFDFRDAFDKELREFSTSNPYGVDLGDETTLGVTRSYFQKYMKDVNRRWSSSYEASRFSDETDDGTKKVSVEQIDNLLYQWLLSVLGFNYSTGTLRQLSKDLWFKDPLPPPPPPPPLLQSLFPTATNYLMPQLSQPSLQNSHIYNPYGYNAATFDEQVAQLGLTSPYTVRQASSSYGNQPAMISNPQQATPQNPFGYQSLSPTFQGYSGYVQQNQAIPSMQSQSFSQPSQITHPVPAMNRTQSPAPPSLQPSRPTSQTPDQTGGALSAADHSPSSLPPLAPLPSLSPLPPLPQAPT